MKNMKILFQGDSITDGNRYKDPKFRGDLNHQIGHSYVFHVVGALGRRSPGKYVFVNRGVGGDSVSALAARWQQDTLDEHPDVLSLLVGINGNGNRDGVYPEGVEEHLRCFDAEYRSLLTSARAQNPALQMVLIEPFALPTGRVKAHYAEFMRAFARKQELIRRIAEDYGAIFIPVQQHLEALVEASAPALREAGWRADPCAYWLWDGIHPTEAFHHDLAELWLDATREIL